MKNAGCGSEQYSTARDEASRTHFDRGGNRGRGDKKKERGRTTAQRDYLSHADEKVNTPSKGSGGNEGKGKAEKGENRL